MFLDEAAPAESDLAVLVIVVDLDLAPVGGGSFFKVSSVDGISI